MKIFATVFAFLFLLACSKSPDGFTCTLDNCLEYVEDQPGTLLFLSCYGEYAILTPEEKDGVIVQKAGVVENLAASLQKDLPKEILFSGWYIEKEYTLAFPDPSLDIGSVNQLVLTKLEVK